MANNQKQSSSKNLKIILGLVFSLIVLGVVGTTAVYAYFNYFVGYAPEQPLPFSHKIHAGIQKIPCQYCHSTVNKSKNANVPGLAVCMNCHSQVKTQSPFIKKLASYYENKTPIAWVKVHVLPDFVFFNHKRHISFGLQCMECHGDVATMDRVQQVAPLNMSWCVNCHRKPEHNANIDCMTCHH